MLGIHRRRLDGTGLNVEEDGSAVDVRPPTPDPMRLDMQECEDDDGGEKQEAGSVMPRASATPLIKRVDALATGCISMHDDGRGLWANGCDATSAMNSRHLVLFAYKHNDDRPLVGYAGSRVGHGTMATPST